MNEPTADGKRLIDAWMGTEQEIDALKRNLSGAECRRSNAINALGKWMMPEDAKDGEVFCVWYGDSLISVTPRNNKMDFEIKIRKRGKSLV